MTAEIRTTPKEVLKSRASADWLLREWFRFWSYEDHEGSGKKTTHRETIGKETPTNVQLTIQLNHDVEVQLGRSIPLKVWEKTFDDQDSHLSFADLHYFATHAIGHLKPLRTFPQFSSEDPKITRRVGMAIACINEELAYLRSTMMTLRIRPKSHPNFCRHLGYSLCQHAKYLMENGWSSTGDEILSDVLQELYQAGEKLVLAADAADPRVENQAF